MVAAEVGLIGRGRWDRPENLAAVPAQVRAAAHVAPHFGRVEQPLRRRGVDFRAAREAGVLVRTGAQPRERDRRPGNARQEPVTGGGAVTVIAAVPLFPSLVAVIVAAPTVTPVTNPLPLTLAIPLLLDAHVTVRPVRTVPALSLVTALSWTA